MKNTISQRSWRKTSKINIQHSSTSNLSNQIIIARNALHIPKYDNHFFHNFVIPSPKEHKLGNCLPFLVK